MTSTFSSRLKLKKNGRNYFLFDSYSNLSFCLLFLLRLLLFTVSDMESESGST